MKPEKELIKEVMGPVISRKRRKKMEEALSFIRAYRAREGISPTVREIGAYLGLSSTSSTFFLIKTMKENGLITTKEGCARSISPTKKSLPSFGDKKYGKDQSLCGSHRQVHP